LSSKRKARSTTILDLTGESSSADVSEDSDITPFSDMSSDTNRMLTQKTGQPKMGRRRPPTTGEWVGMEGVRRELELLKQEHEVLAERDVLAGRFEATAAKIPSADKTDKPVDSLLHIILGEMEAVDHVAERSLKGTFRGRLRAASRRAVAASKLMFTRATIRAVDDREPRRELRAARSLVGERAVFGSWRRR